MAVTYRAVNNNNNKLLLLLQSGYTCNKFETPIIAFVVSRGRRHVSARGSSMHRHRDDEDLDGNIRGGHIDGPQICEKYLFHKPGVDSSTPEKTVRPSP